MKTIFARTTEPMSPKVVPEGSGSRHSTQRNLMLWSLSLTTVFIMAAVLPWWNRFIGVTNDGWHYFFGQQILAGKVPYRDFYLFAPPLYALKNTLLIWIFGDHLIVPHIVAIIELIILALVLVDWGRRLFPVFETTVAVTTALGVYIFGFQSETLGGFHQEAVFFPVLAGWTASLALQRERRGLFAVSGVLSGMAVLAKQTSGVATLACLAVLVTTLVWLRHGKGHAVLAVLSYLVGMLVPIAALCAWLAAKGGLIAFVSDVFLKGTSSKGPLLDMILRPIKMILRSPYYRLYVSLAIVALGLLFWAVRYSGCATEEIDPKETPRRQLLMFFGAVFSALILGFILSRFIGLQQMHPFLQLLPLDFMLFFGEIGCIALFALSGARLFRRRFTEEQSLTLLFAGFGSGLAFCDSFSWADYGSIVLPSLVFTLGYTLSRLGASREVRQIRFAAITFCVLTIMYGCMSRMESPFHWGGWREPNVRSAKQKLAEPELAGFLVSLQSADIVDRVTREIVANSQPGDTVLAYPDIPIFYLLAHRSPATFAYVHYVDVAPDFIDRSDSERILQNPPAVIVYWDQTEQELQLGEQDFRHGNRSGMRDMVAAINALQPKFRVVDTFKTLTGDKFIVMVRARSAMLR